MTQHILLKLAAITITAAAIGASPVSAQSGAAQITVLYDAFGKTSTMKKDWGFAALVEYGGKRILFDTGNNADIFAHNVEAKGIDLRQLDFAVVSHRHGDHTSGLNHLLKVNPGVKIYAPQENFGVFGAALPGSFYKRNKSLPSEMRYFDGKPPEMLPVSAVRGLKAISPGWPRRPRLYRIPLDFAEWNLGCRSGSEGDLVGY